MKALALSAIVAAGVLSGCTHTVDGVVAQTIEPVSVEGMTCADYNALGDRDRLTVIEEITASDKTSRPAFVVGLAQVICQMVPDADLKQILTGLG